MFVGGSNFFFALVFIVVPDSFFLLLSSLLFLSPPPPPLPPLPPPPLSEPLKELYKTEVRALARQLSVPEPLLCRHPFPGPGLGVRLLCSNGGDVAPDVSKEIENVLAPYPTLSGVALPIKSVGVKADVRSYEHPVLLSSADGETSPTWKDLLEATRLILRDVPHVNRVVYNLSGKVPATFEALSGTMTKDRLDLLREADNFVMEGLRRHGLYDTIWQCPTAMVPMSIDGSGTELVVVRPVHTKRAMTASPAMFPDALIEELRRDVLTMEGVSGLTLDLTSKPPGTIEWE